MGHFPRYVVLALFIAIASARSPELDGNSIEDSGRSSNGVFGDIQYVYQIYKECSSADLSSCLKLKLIGAMDRISRSLDINLSDGITLTKDNGLDAEPLTKSEREIEADLPRALEEKEDALNSIILDKVVNFFRSHTLKLKLPNIDELQRSFTEEGRKKKKMGELLAIPLLIGGTLIPLALGALALLAGKALIVSKLALVLASIIGLKKLVSGGGDGGGHEVVQVAGGHGSSGWARSSHDIAYSAYKPHSAYKHRDEKVRSKRASSRSDSIRFDKRLCQILAMFKLLTVFSAGFLAIAVAAPASQQEAVTETTGSLIGDALQVYSSCADQDLTVCLKLKALRFVDRAARSADLVIGDGLRIVQTDEAKADSRANSGRSLNDIEASLPQEAEAKEAAIDEALLERAGKFLASHTVELSVPEEVSRSFDEARGKKKKIVKSLLPILLLLKLKAAALIPIALGALALLAFKALIISKIALVLSGIIALKKLLGQKQSSSYEVVAHPVHSYEDSHHDHHGWSSRSAGSDLAYSAYKPEN
nr:uncharacterized protein LOC124224798 [Neodiprion pinetum]